MATQSFVRDADGAFALWRCRQSRGHPSSESTCELLSAGDIIFPCPLAHRWPTSRPSLGLIPCTESTLMKRAKEVNECNGDFSPVGFLDAAGLNS
jgi:hypothetical protein